MIDQRQQHPTRPVVRELHWLLSQAPPLLSLYRRTKRWLKTDLLPVSIYRKVFERNRLQLPVAPPEQFGPASEKIELPTDYPLFAGEDAPLNDLLFLCNLVKGRKARRILEIGTYRARTTYAFYLNQPEATIVSYDIQLLDSPYRQKLSKVPNVFLRHASFLESASVLRQEPRFDFIFVDGSHQLKHVLNDSSLALELVEKNGLIVWHDYRPNDSFNKELKVPEALNVLKNNYRIYAIAQTFCAVYQKD